MEYPRTVPELTESLRQGGYLADRWLATTLLVSLSLRRPVLLEGEVGVIAPGKLADIVIWNSDPLTDITVLQRPNEVSLIIKDGQIVDRGAGGFRPLSKEPPRARMFVAG